jgi:hypothetical protein
MSALPPRCRRPSPVLSWDSATQAPTPSPPAGPHSASKPSTPATERGRPPPSSTSRFRRTDDRGVPGPPRARAAQQRSHSQRPARGYRPAEGWNSTLLVLAPLGLSAGEVATLSLDDVGLARVSAASAAVVSGRRYPMMWASRSPTTAGAAAAGTCSCVQLLPTPRCRQRPERARCPGLRARGCHALGADRGRVCYPSRPVAARRCASLAGPTNAGLSRGASRGEG